MFSFEQAVAAKTIEQQQLREDNTFDFGHDSDRSPLLGIPAEVASTSGLSDRFAIGQQTLQQCLGLATIASQSSVIT